MTHVPPPLLPPGRTAAFEAYVAPARARPALWRLVVGIAVIAIVWAAVNAALLPAVRHVPRPDAGKALLVLYLVGFSGMVLGVWLAARLLQRRSFASLMGPAGFATRPFLLGVAAMAAIGILAAGPMLLLATPVRQTDVVTWAAWLPLVIPALFVQTAAEELVFRGYLMQGLAARFRSAFAWWLLPSLLFGLLHWNPQDFGPNTWLAVLSAVLTALVLADVTARTGGLSLAMGLHFANNVSALLVLATPSGTGALSLWLAGIDPGDVAGMRALVLADLATTMLAYAAWLAFWHSRRRSHEA